MDMPFLQILNFVLCCNTVMASSSGSLVHVCIYMLQLLWTLVYHSQVDIRCGLIFR